MGSGLTEEELQEAGLSPSVANAEAEAAARQRRQDPRYRVRWRAGVVLGTGAERHLSMMRTLDVSLGGVAMLGHEKVAPAEEFVVMISMPPLQSGGKETIVEARGKLIYSVLDTAKGGFRVGFRLIGFKGDGQKLLRERLEKHHVPIAAS